MLFLSMDMPYGTPLYLGLVIFFHLFMFSTPTLDWYKDIYLLITEGTP